MLNQSFVIQLDQDRSRLQKLLSSPENLIKSSGLSKVHGGKRSEKQGVRSDAQNKVQRAEDAGAVVNPLGLGLTNNSIMGSINSNPTTPAKSPIAKMIFANKSKAQTIEMEDAQNGQARRRETGGVTKNVAHAKSKDAVHESERQRQLHRNLSKFSNK